MCGMLLRDGVLNCDDIRRKRSKRYATINMPDTKINMRTRKLFYLSIDVLIITHKFLVMYRLIYQSA